MQSLSDEELIAAWRQASPNTGKAYLDELFGRHHRRVALWCLRFAGNREEAADLAQDVLARAWRSLEGFQGNSKFSTWLYTVTRNHCLNQVKARALQPDHAAGELPDELAAPESASPADRLDRERRVALAREWMHHSLDQTERQVFALHFEEEMPLDAITRLLQLNNASGAKAYIVSARRKLQEEARRWRARQEAKGGS